MNKKLIFFLIILVGALDSALSQTVDINNLKQRALTGNADAMCELSIAYLKNGDENQACAWIRKAVEAGSVDALYIAYDNGLWFRRDNFGNTSYLIDTKDYFKRVYKLAQQGDVKALLHLGYLYEYGDIVSKNVEEALALYRKAASIDEASLFDNLQLEPGGNWGVNSEMEQFLEEYAKRGNVKAMLLLGDYYLEAVYTEETEEKAKKWYKLAADKGCSEARNKYDAMIKYDKAIQDQERQQAENNKRYKQEFSETMRNFSGYWTCRNSKTQLKFDSKGHGWFKNGVDYTWEKLYIKYIGYNEIWVADIWDRGFTLKVSGNTITTSQGLVYHKR